MIWCGGKEKEKEKVKVKRKVRKCEVDHRGDGEPKNQPKQATIVSKASHHITHSLENREYS
jgi:hypothetical protein